MGGVGGDESISNDQCFDKGRIMWNVIIPAVVTVVVDQLLSDD